MRTPVRFVMHHAFMKLPLVGFLFRDAKVIPIAPARENSETLTAALDAILCSNFKIALNGFIVMSQYSQINIFIGEQARIVRSIFHACDVEICEADNMKMVSKLGVAAFEKKQIAAIIDSINLGIIIIDLHNDVSHVNDYMLKLIKKSWSEAVGCPIAEFLNHGDIQSFISQQEDGANYRNFFGIAPDETDGADALLDDGASAA